MIIIKLLLQIEKKMVTTIKGTEKGRNQYIYIHKHSYVLLSIINNYGTLHAVNITITS